MISTPLDRLKVLLFGLKLQQAPGVGYPWEVDYLLDYLHDALRPDTFNFLHAALAAINDPAGALDLDRFPLWRDTPALKPDTPWPDPAAMPPEPPSMAGSSPVTVSPPASTEADHAQ